MTSQTAQYEAEKSKVGEVLGASLSGNKEALQYAITTKPTAVLQYVDANQRNALHFAAYGGHSELCVYILDCLADDSRRRLALDGKDAEGNTPLRLAVRCEKFEAIQTLFEKSNQVGAECIKEGLLLHDAAKVGNAPLTKYLLETLGHQVDARDAIGTPLFWCAFDNNVEVASLLIHAGADVNATDDEGVSVLFVAVTSGAEGVISLLLDNGASLFVDASKDGKTTVLHAAAGEGLTAPLKLLLEQENVAEALEFRSRGMTPVEFAAFSGHKHLVELFIATSGGNMEELMSQMTSKREEAESNFTREYAEGLENCKSEKQKGNAFFLSSHLAEALLCYTAAIDLAQSVLYKLETFRHGNSKEEQQKLSDIKENHLAPLLCNRSACHLKIRDFQSAKDDAEYATQVAPQWPKAYYRLGVALSHLKLHADSAQALWTGYELAPRDVGAGTILEMFKKKSQ